MIYRCWKAFEGFGKDLRSLLIPSLRNCFELTNNSKDSSFGTIPLIHFRSGFIYRSCTTFRVTTKKLGKKGVCRGLRYQLQTRIAQVANHRKRQAENASLFFSPTLRELCIVKCDPCCCGSISGNRFFFVRDSRLECMKWTKAIGWLWKRIGGNSMEAVKSCDGNFNDSAVVAVQFWRRRKNHREEFFWWESIEN